jgi:pimeloyl-ACP methyl ester carboxylesterase
MTSKLFRAEREGSNPPVIFLHGFGYSHDTWQSFPERLGIPNRCILYDLPGHAGSLDFPGNFSPRRAGEAILADLDAQNIEKFHLVGHSMGGAISCLIAMAASERVASLTLVAPGGFGPEINADLLRSFAGAASHDELRNGLKLMSGPDHEPEKTAIDTLANYRKVRGQTEKLQEIAAIITRDGRQGALPRANMENFGFPVSIVWGDADDVLPFSQTNDLPANFRFFPIKGAGHMLPEENPDIVADAIRQTVSASSP